MALWETYTALTMPQASSVAWVWDKRIPAGHVSFIGGSPGTGKSVLMWGLALSVVAGIPFLDAEVEQGPVLLYDFDSEPGAQGHVMHSVRRGLRLSPSDIDDRLIYRTPSAKGVPVMDDDRLVSIPEDARAAGAVAVIIDAWTSAFWTVRSNDTEQVARKLAELRLIAKSGAAVIMVDHAPKPVANAPGVIERGLLGSTMKLAGARAAYLLTRVPPRDIDGRDVGALHTLKNNLGPIHAPLGVERTWYEGAVTFGVADLPEGEPGAVGRTRAQAAVREVLTPGRLVAKSDLQRTVMSRASVQTRTIEAAVARMIQSGEIESVPMPHDRRARGYRVMPTAVRSQ